MSAAPVPPVPFDWSRSDDRWFAFECYDCGASFDVRTTAAAVDAREGNPLPCPLCGTAHIGDAGVVLHASWPADRQGYGSRASPSAFPTIEAARFAALAGAALRRRRGLVEKEAQHHAAGTPSRDALDRELRLIDDALAAEPR